MAQVLLLRKYRVERKSREPNIYDLVRIAFTECRRFDIVITYNKKMYILELKIWHGEEYHKKGLMQLGEYLDQYGLSEGYLLIFDFRKLENKTGKVNEVNVKVRNKAKKIIEVYC